MRTYSTNKYYGHEDEFTWFGSISLFLCIVSMIAGMFGFIPIIAHFDKGGLFVLIYSACAISWLYLCPFIFCCLGVMASFILPSSMTATTIRELINANPKVKIQWEKERDDFYEELKDPPEKLPIDHGRDYSWIPPYKMDATREEAILRRDTCNRMNKELYWEEIAKENGVKFNLPVLNHLPSNEEWDARGKIIEEIIVSEINKKMISKESTTPA